MASLMNKAPAQAPSAQRTSRRSVAALSSCSMRIPKAQVFASVSPQVGSQQVQAAPQVLVASRRTACQATSAPASASSSSSTAQTTEWYALVASADFYFNDPQNESLAEQLRERVRFFKEQGRENDFYLVPEPKWLEAKYPEQAKRVKKPSVALVSTDKNFIVFMKLRLDRVLRIDLGAMPESEVTAVGGKVPDYGSMPNWTAPYAQYAPGWWKVFEPKH